MGPTPTGGASLTQLLFICTCSPNLQPTPELLRRQDRSLRCALHRRSHPARPRRNARRHAHRLHRDRPGRLRKLPDGCRLPQPGLQDHRQARTVQQLPPRAAQTLSTIHLPPGQLTLRRRASSTPPPIKPEPSKFPPHPQEITQSESPSPLYAKRREQRPPGIFFVLALLRSSVAPENELADPPT